MVKLEKIPLGWAVVNEESSFNLVDEGGNTQSSIVYNLNKDFFGKEFVEIVSIGSKERGRGYYGILYPGFEHFVISMGASYLLSTVRLENRNSINIHEHLGFSQVKRFSHKVDGKLRVEVRKNISPT